MDNVFENIDRAIVLNINSWHNTILDEIMWGLSSKLPWIPFYILLVYLGYKNLNIKKFFLFTLTAILCVVLSDLVCTHFFKEVFQRYRPSHNLLLMRKLHFYENKPGEFYKGGMYGFISSHAANFFAIAIFVGLSLKVFYPKLIYFLLLIAATVSFSRVYLGVHYLSDIIIGGAVGCIIANLCYFFIFRRFMYKSK